MKTWLGLILALALGLLPAGAGENPRPKPLWTKVLPGRMVGQPALTPTRLALVLNEDKHLYGFDQTGGLKIDLQRGQRFLPWLVIPDRLRAGVGFVDGTFSLANLAEPQPHWQWTFDLGSPLSCAPAVDRGGNLYLGTKAGGLFCLSREGQQFWTATTGAPVEAAAIDVGGRLLVVSGGSLWTWDLSGRLLTKKPALNQVLGLLIASDGGVVVWNQKAVKRLAEAPLPEWELVPEGLPPLRGCLLTGTEDVLVIGRNQTGLIHAGQWRPGPALPPEAEAEGVGVINGQDQVLLPTRQGLVVLDGPVVSLEKSWGDVTGLALSPEGLLLTAGRDWMVRSALTAGVRAAGWSQEGGNQGHTWLSGREGSWEELLALWSAHPDFQLLNALASKPDDDSQKKLLTELETKLARGTLLEEWPFANLLITRLALSGIGWVQTEGLRVLNNWPANRSRAYRLLAQTADSSLRKLLLDALLREFDSEALSGAVDSLGRMGYDYDGTVSRALDALQRRKPRDARIASALPDAAIRLWLFNHRIPDQALLEALTRIYQGNFPREIRQKAQSAFQKIMGFKVP